MMWFTLLIILFIKNSLAIIYDVNETEYHRMPPVFYLDNYEVCMRDKNAEFCNIELDLVSDEENELLKFIKEYSDFDVRHFNHTHISHGICVTQKCSYANNTDFNKEEYLEKCLNTTYWQTYGLKTKIREIVSCTKKDRKIDAKVEDFAVLGVCLTILLLNIIACIYDSYTRKYSKEGNRILNCFSIQRNWRKLSTNSSEGPEERLRQLQPLNGIKAIAIIAVIFIHASMPFSTSIENSQFYEKQYNQPSFLYFCSVSMSVQIFFINSGFLLAYNLLLYSEKRNIQWTMIPKGILSRWLRLTPPYAIILAIIATLLKFTENGAGPLWQKYSGVDVDDCRKYWFTNLLYYNNYVHESQCMEHTWYIASDFQLYVLGLILLVLFKGKVQIMASIAFLLIGIGTTSITTYWYDLDGTNVVRPEYLRYTLLNSPTYQYSYRPGHTNIICYAMGIIFAHFVYRIQKNQYDFGKIRKYHYFTVPFVHILGFFIFASGIIFYATSPRKSLLFRTVYASVFKFSLGFFWILFEIITLFRIDKIFYNIISMKIWVPLSKISYCAYLIHITFVRMFNSSQVALLTNSHFNVFSAALLFELVSFMFGLVLWLLIEAPMCQLTKILFSPPSSKNEVDTATVLEGDKEKNIDIQSQRT